MLRRMAKGELWSAASVSRRRENRIHIVTGVREMDPWVGGRAEWIAAYGKCGGQYGHRFAGEYGSRVIHSPYNGGLTGALQVVVRIIPKRRA